jgi:hypothetical protein
MHEWLSMEQIHRGRARPLFSGGKLMNRRLVFAVSGFVAVAVVAVLALYVGTLKAADSAAQKKSKGTLSAAERIEQLQQRIEQLEQRITTLESRPLAISAPQLQLGEGQILDSDGFPRARVLLINENAANGSIMVPGDNLITPGRNLSPTAEPYRGHPVNPTRRVNDSNAGG